MGCTGKPLRVLKNNKYLEMVTMQLQKNTWHEGILEEANVRGLVDKLPEMLKNYMNRFISCFQRSEQVFNVQSKYSTLMVSVH